MPRQRSGFKVVQRINGRLWSFNERAAGPGRRPYKLNKTTRPAPNCGPLCVFVTCQAANDLRWAFGKKYFAVYRVKYRPSTIKGIWLTHEPAPDGQERHGTFFPIHALQRAYPGTVLADEITLVERVSP